MKRWIWMAALAAGIGMHAAPAAADQAVFRLKAEDVSPVGSTPGETTPGISRFVPANPMPSISAGEGERVELVVGSYEGSATQWSCQSASWLTCTFENGRAIVRGTAVETAGPSLAIVVRGPDGTQTVSIPAVVASTPPSFLAMSRPTLFAESGRTTRFQIGTFTGRADGWTCSGRSSRFDAWQSCDFEDGKVFLVVTPPAGSGVFNRSIDVARNGDAMGNTANIFILHNNDRYLTAARTEDPRPYTLSSPVIGSVHTTRGLPFRRQIATYTGGDEGWACFAQSGSGVPSWMNCAFENGRVYLEMSSSEQQESYFRMGIARDGVSASETLFGAVIQPGSYNSQPRFDAPRPGTVAWTPSGDFIVDKNDRYSYRVANVTGGSEGWSCWGSSSNLPFWFGCDIRDDGVYVTVDGSDHARRYGRIMVARDGTTVGESGLFTALVADIRYDNGASTPATPRGGAVQQISNPQMAVGEGQQFSLPIATYSGGEGGWACAGDGADLRTWTRCEFSGGVVRLVGTAPRDGFVHARIVIARDGRYINSTAQVRINR